MNHIIITGSLAYDRIMDYPGYFKEHIFPDKIHILNVAFNIERLEEKRGGTAGNIAYNLTLLNEKPTIVAAVGFDFDPYEKHLENFGLSIDHIEKHYDIHTAAAYIMTDRDDNQITGFHMGAMNRETHADLTMYAAADTLVLLSPGNKRDMLHYSEQCRALGMKYIFDPGQTLNFLTDEEIRTIADGAYMLIGNDYEMQMITNKTGWGANELRQKVSVLVTTMGKDGSEIKVSGSEKIQIVACQSTKVKDPTGAGDAYRAGLLKGLINGLHWQECGQLAATAAIYAVEHYGTQEHHYTMADFCSRYEENFGSTCPSRVAN